MADRQTQARAKAPADEDQLNDLTPLEREILDEVLAAYPTLPIAEALALLRLGGM
jgi:FixJ family two-component response regulator